jgi:predicted RNase H-like nuclease
VGVDGCRAGWFAVSLSATGSWRFDVHADFVSVWARYEDARIILVDIPIGLVESGQDGRQCDTIARRYLGRVRASSVFTRPARPATAAPDRLLASAINKRLTGRGITIQSWAITPKIREVDRLLRKNKKARGMVREVHPELLFWALNGRRAMVNRKSRLIGYEERLTVLRQSFGPTKEIADAALAGYRRSVVARDDILDALVAAITGYLGNGQLSTIPDDVPTDAYGLPMEMAYFLP